MLDPVTPAGAEHLAYGIAAATGLLDTWRADSLLVGGVAIGTYSLTANMPTYTIGEGGAFNQIYPTTIERWSVVPDDDATDTLEIAMGRPYTDDQWQLVRMKTQTGPRPSVLYYDHAYAAGMGTCWFHPIPDNNDVDVKLYTRIPAITALVAATPYDLRPAFMRALTLHLAIELADSYDKPVTPRLEKLAREALGELRLSNIRPKEAATRSEYAINSGGRRGHNIYTDGR